MKNTCVYMFKFFLILAILFTKGIIANADESCINVGNKIFEADNLNTASDICKYYKLQEDGDKEWKASDGSTISVSQTDSTVYGRRTEVWLKSSSKTIRERLQMLGYSPVNNLKVKYPVGVSGKPMAVYNGSGRYCAVYRDNGGFRLIFYRVKKTNKT